MTERLRRLVRDDLDSEQLAVYRTITEGPRAAGRQLFALADDVGALNGPFGVLLHAPSIGGPLQELGAAVRYGTRMSDRCREIAILLVAVGMSSDFEWYAHERIGRAVGLDGAELEALQAGTFRPEDPVEGAVTRLCELLLGDSDIGDEEYARLVAELGEPLIIEVTVLVGYYRTLAQLLQVFAIGAPADA